MGHKLSFRQLNYIMHWFNDFQSEEPDTKFNVRVKAFMKEFNEKMDFLYEPGLDPKLKLRELSIDLEQEIIEYVAEAIQGNIRELEGSLNAIVCQYRLKNKPLSVSEIKNLLKNNIKPKKNVAIKDVVKIVSEYYSLDESPIYEKTRRKEIVKARQVVMYLLREEFNVSYPLIGQKLGGKDHTTVIHSYLKIKEDLKNDPQLLQELEQIKIMFK